MLTPMISLASDKKCDDNIYEINQRLKARTERLDSKPDKVQNHDVANFKKSHDITCNNISSTCKNRSYQSVKLYNTS
jgi:hypothetical protein